MNIRAMSVMVIWLLAGLNGWTADVPLVLVGTSVNPHFMLDSMRYTKPPEPPDGALVTLYLRHDGQNHEPLTISSDLPVKIQNRAPDEWLESGDLAWHDFPGAHPDLIRVVPPEGLTTLTFNGRKKPFGTGARSPYSWALTTIPCGQDP